MSTPRSEFWAGVRAELPIIVGVMPFGLIYGVLAIEAGIPPWIAFGMSSIVFAGSAQFIATQLISDGAPALVMLLTTFIVNVRHMLYSASLAPYSKTLSSGWKWLLSYLLTDEAYVVTVLHYEDKSKRNPHQHWFWFGAGITLWANWQFWTAVGILFGTQVPESWALDFTLALTFIGMVVPVLSTRPMLAAAVSAAVVAVLTNPLPYKMSLMIACLVGIGVGYLLEIRTEKRQQEEVA